MNSLLRLSHGTCGYFEPLSLSATPIVRRRVLVLLSRPWVSREIKLTAPSGLARLFIISANPSTEPPTCSAIAIAPSGRDQEQRIKITFRRRRHPPLRQALRDSLCYRRPPADGDNVLDICIFQCYQRHRHYLGRTCCRTFWSAFFSHLDPACRLFQRRPQPSHYHRRFILPVSRAGSGFHSPGKAKICLVRLLPRHLPQTSFRCGPLTHRKDGKSRNQHTKPPQQSI